MPDSMASNACSALPETTDGFNSNCSMIISSGSLPEFSDSIPSTDESSDSHPALLNDDFQEPANNIEEMIDNLANSDNSLNASLESSDQNHKPPRAAPA